MATCVHICNLVHGLMLLAGLCTWYIHTLHMQSTYTLHIVFCASDPYIYVRVIFVYCTPCCTEYARGWYKALIDFCTGRVRSSSFADPDGEKHYRLGRFSIPTRLIYLREISVPFHYYCLELMRVCLNCPVWFN